MRKFFLEMTATGFYTGYLPLAPGTWASWAAAMLAFVIGHFFPEYSKLICFFAALFFFGVGVPASHFWSKAVKRKDPGFIVIDEWAGQFLTYSLVVATPLNVFVG